MRADCLKGSLGRIPFPTFEFELRIDYQISFSENLGIHTGRLREVN